MKHDCECEQFYLAIEVIRTHAAPPPTLIRKKRTLRTRMTGADPARGLLRFHQDHYQCSVCATEWIEDQELGWFRSDEPIPGA